MCTVVSSGPCQCSTGAGSSIPGPLAVLAAVLVAAWAVLRYVVAPVTVAAVWWLSGGQIIHTRRRRYRRYVHAAGRILLTLVTVAALAWPVATGGTLLALGLGLAATVTIRRDRRRRAARPAPAGPIRVTARVRRSAAAVTDHPAGPGSSWSAERFARTSSTGYRVRP